MSNSIEFYSKNAEKLSKQYDSVAFESVHKGWLDNIPKQGRALDVGAGSGRDARYLAAKGLCVVAVEPASDIRQLAQRSSAATSIQWIDDRLHELSSVLKLDLQFELILLSAVWMHLAPEERPLAIRRLALLLEENGLLVITLRYGAFSDDRTAYPVSVSEITQLAKAENLEGSYIGEVHSDELGRNTVQWQTVCLRKEASSDVR